MHFRINYNPLLNQCMRKRDKVRSNILPPSYPAMLNSPWGCLGDIVYKNNEGNEKVPIHELRWGWLFKVNIHFTILWIRQETETCSSIEHSTLLSYHTCHSEDDVKWYFRKVTCIGIKITKSITYVYQVFFLSLHLQLSQCIIITTKVQ